MDQLPAEIIYQIITCIISPSIHILILIVTIVLRPPDIVKLQLLSRRLLTLTRDDHLWRQLCYVHSRSAARARRREMLFSQPAPLAALVQAVSPLEPFSHLTLSPDQENVPGDILDSGAKNAARRLSNWDPTYASEKVGWYQQYVQRYAKIKASWFQTPVTETAPRECTGMGVLYTSESVADKLIAPMDDGSIAYWDLAPNDPFNRQQKKGLMVGRSAVGLLTEQGANIAKDRRLAHSQAMMTKTGAVECVSIDSESQRGYFTMQEYLNEVDLRTGQLASRHRFPFPITCLSEARPQVPLTVGTNLTLHIHDPRSGSGPSDGDPTLRCEWIGGTPPKSDITSHTSRRLRRQHVNLSQPGPLSILHLPSTRSHTPSYEIWVAGRFTSLLSYDRRFFPKIASTIHSGARISCLTSLPYPFLRSASGLTNRVSFSELDNIAIRSLAGASIIAAGQYKSKGSLEIYGLSPDPEYKTLSMGFSVLEPRNIYRNRQTVSRCKLLSVASHGTTLVYSDGDGNVKWVERDGSTPVRQWNVNPEPEQPSARPFELEQTTDSLLSDRPLIQEDLVQKLIPISTAVSRSRPDELVLWTGEGKLGLLCFGDSSGFDASTSETILSAEDELKARQEREYAGTMRRALERQADEVRWFGAMDC